MYRRRWLTAMRVSTPRVATSQGAAEDGRQQAGRRTQTASDPEVEANTEGRTNVRPAARRVGDSRPLYSSIYEAACNSSTGFASTRLARSVGLQCSGEPPIVSNRAWGHSNDSGDNWESPSRRTIPGCA